MFEISVSFNKVIHELQIKTYETFVETLLRVTYVTILHLIP